MCLHSHEYISGVCWMKHALKLIFQIVFLIVLGLVCAVLFWLGPVVKFSLQAAGPALVGVPVSMESLSINLLEGKLLLKDFEMGNYPGFRAPRTLGIEEVEVSVDMASLFKGEVLVNAIRIAKPEIVYETNGRTSNIDELLANISALSEPKEEEGSLIRFEEETPKKSKLKVKVQALLVENGAVMVVSTAHPELDTELAFNNIAFLDKECRLYVNGLRLKNPEGFESANVFELTNITVCVDPASLYSGHVIINDVQINAPRIILDRNAATSNLSQLLALVKGFPSGESKPEKREELVIKSDRNNAEKEEPPVVLEHVGVAGFKVVLHDSTASTSEVLFSLSSVSLVPGEGSLSLRGIQLLNPQGFVMSSLFELAEISVGFVPETLVKGPLSVNEITFSSPHVTLEHNGKQANDLLLMERIKRYLPEASAPEAPQKNERKQGRDAPSETIKLAKLTVDDFKVNVHQSGTLAVPKKAFDVAGISQVVVFPLDGRVVVDNIYVNNPEGFTAPSLFKLENINVAFQSDSLRSPPLVIESIDVLNPEVHLERTPEAVNVQSLVALLSRFVPQAEPTVDQPKATPGSSKAAPPVLRLVSVKGTKVYIINTPDADASKDSLLLLDVANIAAEPIKGELLVENLTLGNPPDFSNKSMVELGRLRVGVELESLKTKVATVKYILVDKPVVAYERKLQTDNLKALQQWLAAFTTTEKQGEADASAPSSPTKEPAPADEKQKVIVVHLQVKEGMVKAKVSALPTAPIPLPVIEMSDIGKDKGGASLIDISSRIVTALYDSIIGAVANVTGIAGDALKGAGSLTVGAFEAGSDVVTGTITDPGGTLKNAGDATVEAGKAVSESAVGVVKGVGKLVGITGAEKEEEKESTEREPAAE